MATRLRRQPFVVGGSECRDTATARFLECRCPYGAGDDDRVLRHVSLRRVVALIRFPQRLAMRDRKTDRLLVIYEEARQA